jgi:hypothetical protein
MTLRSRRIFNALTAAAAAALISGWATPGCQVEDPADGSGADGSGVAGERLRTDADDRR